MPKDLFLTKTTATLMPCIDCGNPQNPTYTKAITRVSFSKQNKPNDFK
jgi:hypothetical protein